MKINYTLNILCSMSEEDGKLIDALTESEELSIFETCLVRDLIDWRWSKFAMRIHVVGFKIHII